MHIPQAVSTVPANPAKDRIGFYGLGSNVSYTRFGTPQWSHSGAFNLGAATAYYLLPAGGFGVVALTNGSPLGAPEAFCLTLVDIVQGVEDIPDWIEIVGNAFAAIDAPAYGADSDWTTAPTEPTSALANEVYAGIYHNDYFGDVEVAPSGDALVLRIGPK